MGGARCGGAAISGQATRGIASTGARLAHDLLELIINVKSVPRDARGGLFGSSRATPFAVVTGSSATQRGQYASLCEYLAPRQRLNEPAVPRNGFGGRDLR